MNFEDPQKKLDLLKPENKNVVTEAEKINHATAEEADQKESRRKSVSILEAIKQGKGGEEYDRIRERIKDLDERVVIEPDFEMRADNKEGKIQIYLSTKEGKEISLNEYLANGYEFEAGRAFFVHLDRKKVVFENMENPSAFLISLFHELGHADRDVNVEQKWSAKAVEKIREFFAQAFAEARYMKANKKATEIPESVFDVSGNIRLSGGKDYTPLWYRKHEQKKRAKSERGAWAFALANLRKLKKEGVDVFSGFLNNQEIFDYINNCLCTHEGAKARLFQMIVSDNEDFKKLLNAEAMKPLFTKK
jgi:hypothetical protein